MQYEAPIVRRICLYRPNKHNAATPIDTFNEANSREVIITYAGIQIFSYSPTLVFIDITLYGQAESIPGGGTTVECSGEMQDKSI